MKLDCRSGSGFFSECMNVTTIVLSSVNSTREGRYELMSMVFFAADQSLFPARLTDHCFSRFGEENLETPPVIKAPINTRKIATICLVWPIATFPRSAGCLNQSNPIQHCTSI